MELKLNKKEHEQLQYGIAESIFKCVVEKDKEDYKDVILPVMNALYPNGRMSIN